MKKSRFLAILACALVMAGLALLLASPAQPKDSRPISQANAANMRRLLTDLVKAYENPSAEDEQILETDLRTIRAVNARDYAIASAVARHWKQVYLDPDYELLLHHGEQRAQIAGSGIPNSPRHAIVILGFELMNGQMQPELEDRCEAGAALARALPSAILVCSGGATGSNNPEGHTEAGLMKQYLTDNCGIEAERIFIDEDAMTTAENALNTFEILQKEGVRTMTVVTSDYHQRWGQAVYNAVAALYRQQHGYAVEIVGNYSCAIEAPAIFAHGDQIASRQIAGILQLPPERASTPQG